MVESKLFVSHAASDLPVVDAFVRLLEGGVGVPASSIFCTSLKGQGIRPGVDFKESVRANLDGATTVVALISENFYTSAFCMCELGGVWIQSKDFLPVLVPPIRFADMKAVLEGLQALRLDNEEDLDELRDEVAKRLDIKALPTPRWTQRRKEFLQELPDKLKLLSPATTVAREKYDKLTMTVTEYESALETAEEENKKLMSLVDKLKASKDAKAVAKIMRDEMEAADVFDELAGNAATSLQALASVSQEAMFSRERKSDFFVGAQSSRYTWDEAQAPLEYKEILLNSDEDGVSPNDDNPKVKAALGALADLRRWLEGEAPEEFWEWYAAEHDGEDPDLTNRAFWDRHLW